MEPITDFSIVCYQDIYESLQDIYKKIKIPSTDSLPSTHVFDEDKSVKWNREQVELYNKKSKDLRNEAIELRNQSLRNLNEATINYLAKYEAQSDTPRAVIEAVLRRAQLDHEDEWWNYLSRYLDFAEIIYRIRHANDLGKTLKNS